MSGLDQVSEVVFDLSSYTLEAIQDKVNKQFDVITLSSKPELTFLKEHQTGACQFDALSRAKVTLSLSFT